MTQPTHVRNLIVGFAQGVEPAKVEVASGHKAYVPSVRIQPQDTLLPSTFSGYTVKPTADRTGYALSLYDDKKADATSIATLTLKLSAVYPNAFENPMFSNVLTDAVIRNNMTEKQLEDAVNHLIDTNPYKTFSIAEIVSYDKRVPLMDHGEYCRRCAEGVNRGDDFETVKVDGKCYWVLKSDIINARNGVRRK